MADATRKDLRHRHASQCVCGCSPFFRTLSLKHSSIEMPPDQTSRVHSTSSLTAHFPDSRRAYYIYLEARIYFIDIEALILRSKLHMKQSTAFRKLCYRGPAERAGRSRSSAPVHDRSSVSIVRCDCIRRAIIGERRISCTGQIPAP